jgi:hypothetical protein
VVFIVAVEDGVLPHERVGQHPTSWKKSGGWLSSGSRGQKRNCSSATR